MIGDRALCVLKYAAASLLSLAFVIDSALARGNAALSSGVVWGVVIPVSKCLIGGWLECSCHGSVPGLVRFCPAKLV